MNYVKTVYRIFSLKDYAKYNIRKKSSASYNDTAYKQWSRVIKEAEKIVGYPTSFLNLRWLLSDEVSNMATYLRKLVGSDHPLMETVKNLLYSKQNNMQPWGLVILLLSKSVKQVSDPQNTSCDQSYGLLQTQRMLAEVTEMIRTGHLIHKGLINMNAKNIIVNEETAKFGNKIGLLAGDYLLATSKQTLAKIRNQKVAGNMSTALRDLTEGEFFGEQDPQNFPIPGKPIEHDDELFEIELDTKPIQSAGCLGKAKKEWTVRNMMGGGSLLGRGCQGAMILADQTEDIQGRAYLFGCHLSLAWQAAYELEKVTSNDAEIYSLVSAPVLFALEDNKDLYDIIRDARNGIVNIDYEKLKENIMNTTALKKTRKLIEEHTLSAKQFTDSLENYDSVAALKNLMPL